MTGPWPSVWHRGQRILLSRAWMGEWAWRQRPAFLRPGARRKAHLWAGPWVGEFGWELMNWQAFLRALRPHYARITVCARESSRALYADFCDDFVPHGLRGHANAHVLFGIHDPAELKRLLAMRPADCDALAPLRYIPADAQRFLRFGDASRAPEAVDVLLHARGRGLASERNWSAAKWQELAGRLLDAGARVGWIGLPSDTLDIGIGRDLRGRPLAETLDLLAAARMVAGPSSGPLHLASLCGTPHLVWTNRKTYGMGKTSREKYESWWNPLRTPVTVLDNGFDPTVDEVAGLIARQIDAARLARP
jgi:hypothetical protein